MGDYATYVSRIRQDSTIENGLNMWGVSDNLRNGAALNAVQIAETLTNRAQKIGRTSEEDAKRVFRQQTVRRPDGEDGIALSCLGVWKRKIRRLVHSSVAHAS